jgi:hypothetical protein
MSQNDISDGHVFITCVIICVIGGIAWFIFMAWINFGVGRFVRQNYGCTCGGIFKMDEGLSEQEAERLLGELGGTSARPRYLQYKCDRCGSKKQRFKEPGQIDIVWKEPDYMDVG